MSNDAALDELRRQRMSQLQVNIWIKKIVIFFEKGGQQQQQQRQQMEEMTNSMLGQILDQSARARLNNVALVNPQKAKQTEAMLMQMARSGKVQKNF